MLPQGSLGIGSHLAMDGRGLMGQEGWRGLTWTPILRLGTEVMTLSIEEEGDTSPLVTSRCGC